MSSQRECISTSKVPRPLQCDGLPLFSWAVKKGNLMYLSGQLGLAASTETLADGVSAQTELALKNIGQVLEAVGSSYDQVLKVTVYLADMNDFLEMNKAYIKFFPTNPPARTAFQAAALPLGGRVEIEAIATTDPPNQ